MIGISDSIIFLTDSYKASHWKQYPPGTEVVHSYLESRGGKFDRNVFFGLQYFIDKYLLTPVIKTDVTQARFLFDKHLGPGAFNKAGWDYIIKEHGGHLPLKIWAVPEGSVHAPRTPLIVVENTDPACFWLTNYIETLLVNVWYPCTVATQSFHAKQLLREYLQKTADDEALAGLSFKLHDFGARGVTCPEQAGLGGCAHLTSFDGTDTLQALLVATEYYGDDYEHGKSIPASEHSTITSWGREHEVDAMRNMLTQYPNGLVACVSDSFNIFEACSELWGTQLKNQVLARDGVLVVRPDSGSFRNIPILLDLLGEKFGISLNSKGYKVLNPKVRLIQGDGINLESMAEILRLLDNCKWSTDNLAFGSGGGLLQQMDRDTCKYAFKCSAVKVNGEWRDVYKDPVTDPGKVSKRGRISTEGMVQVYHNGIAINGVSLQEVRDNINTASIVPKTCTSNAVCGV